MSLVVQHRRRARNTLIFGVISCVLIFSTLCLAQWQWGRAHTKRALQQAALQQGKIPALLVIAEMPKHLLPFRHVKVSGYWLPQQGLFLENQVYNGRVGYRVVMPFKTSNGELLAVDRGWLPKTFEHEPAWKEHKLKQQFVELEWVNWPPKRPLLKQGPTIQGLSAVELESVWGLSLHSALWREHGAGENGLIRSWPVIGEDEINKHLSYAGQWLLFGLMIFGAYGFYVWKQWFRPS